MSKEQRGVYEATKEYYLEKLDELDDDDRLRMYDIFVMFTRLQQIVSGFDDDGEYQHERLNTLLEVVSEIEDDEKIVIWAKFQYDIEQIVQALSDKYGEDMVAQFHGKINEKKRNQEVERFRKNARFFVATQSAGGHGLTLNEASQVVFYNNNFKYSERAQAEDRCHRIGQTKSVVYTDIECISSIDSRISDALIRKESVLEAFKRQVDKVKREGLREMINSL